MSLTLTAKFQLIVSVFYSFQHKNPNQIHIMNWDFFFATPVTDIAIVTAAFIGKYFAFLNKAFSRGIMLFGV